MCWQPFFHHNHTKATVHSVSIELSNATAMVNKIINDFFDIVTPKSAMDHRLVKEGSTVGTESFNAPLKESGSPMRNGHAQPTRSAGQQLCAKRRLELCPTSFLCTSINLFRPNVSPGHALLAVKCTIVYLEHCAVEHSSALTPIQMSEQKAQISAQPLLLNSFYIK
jgi:hypothetical protein